VLLLDVLLDVLVIFDRPLWCPTWVCKPAASSLCKRFQPNALITTRSYYSCPHLCDQQSQGGQHQSILGGWSIKECQCNTTGFIWTQWVNATV